MSIAHRVDTRPPRAPRDVVRPGSKPSRESTTTRQRGTKPENDALHGQVARAVGSSAGAVERHLVVDTALAGQPPVLRSGGHARRRS